MNNSYKQYLEEIDAAYCTLYPNVGDIFPLELKVSSLLDCCKLGSLRDKQKLQIEERHRNGMLESFKEDDLCFCFQEGVILIKTWDGVSDPYQTLDVERAKIDFPGVDPEEDKVGDILKERVIDFAFHEMDQDVPWILCHIFLLNANWLEVPLTVDSASWNLSLERISVKDEWEFNYDYSFNILLNDKIRAKIMMVEYEEPSIYSHKQQPIEYYE